MSSLKNFDQLEECLERDPDNFEQILYWYTQLGEYEIDGSEPTDHLLLIFRGLKWIMQYEHTAAEELKEIAERQAVELAEKEELWEQEREMLKDELSSLRQRLTSTAGMDEMNEAFRAEIDSLNAENAHLKQIGRERDRELADQRDKVEELTGKIGVFERERNAWTNTQIQLEDTIRELNRRLSSKTDRAPRNEWESRKLKQRSEQALMLGNQLRNADTQNAELKERVEKLTKALEEATALLQETTKKYEKLREQFGQATTTSEKLLASNQDLKRLLGIKDEMLNEKQQSDESSTKQLEELLRTKESQIQRLREANQKCETEIEELQARIQSEHSVEKEEELEHLRLELVEATKVARQLFGESMSGAGEDSLTTDLSAKLRLRIVQVGRELDVCRQQLEASEEERTQLAKTVEQKDARSAQLYAELDRVRKLAFGETDNYIRDLEKQIEFRDRQIIKLTLKCSLMQLDLEGISDPSGKSQDGEKLKEGPGEKKLREGPKEKKKLKERPKETLREKPGEKKKSKQRKRVEKKYSAEKQEVRTKEEDSAYTEGDSPVEQEEEEEVPEQRKRFSALELIKMFDDNDIDDQSVNDLNLLSSLFIELKKLTQQLSEKDRKVEEVSELIKENQSKMVEQSAKFKKLQDEYEKFRMDIFGGDMVETDADVLRKRIEHLQIENMELQRLADGVRIGGAELERRFEEATRRLIHLGIQVNQYERKTINLDRRHRALREECDRLRVQLMRIQSGDERRFRQLSRENEMNMIEIAHLQNTLVHSVSLQSYNKLLSDFKRLLRTKTVGQSKGTDEDYGYESEVDKQQLDVSLNTFLRQNRTEEQVLTENQRLKETNEILSRQIEYWKRQHARQVDETQELNAFLDDLEDQTDLKSMIANIERRFLQALHEQSDSVEEQLSNEKELKRLRREIHANKIQWRRDRQKLVEIILNLQLSVRRLRANSVGSLSVQQLMDFRTVTEELKIKEQNLDKQLNDAELKLVELGRKEALAEASRESVEHLLAGTSQLQNMQLAFHIKTLANELKANQKKLDLTSDKLKRQMEENTELRKELDELAIGSTDALKLNLFESFDGQDNVETKPTILPSKIPAFTDSEESSTDSDKQISRSAPKAETPSILEAQSKQGIIFDNSKEYEHEINAIKKAAKISIQNYKEQLERKERTLDEYRSLLNELAASERTRFPQQQSSLSSGLQFKRSTEILNNEKDEERDKQLIILRWELGELEEANANLAEQLRQAIESKYVLEPVQKHTASSQTDFLSSSIRPPLDGHQTDDSSITGEEIRGGTRKSPDRESSDSGTAVNDLEDEEELDVRKAKERKRSNSTRTIESVSRFNELQRPSSALSEAQIFQHRNEIRRLRNRITALELKNRELTTECDSLKQRNRHMPPRNPDPNAEVNLLRKESDRMRRENKNLHQTLKAQSSQIEELEKKLKRKTEHMRDTIESWEEKKALEKELKSVRQKLQIAENKLLELNDKLERRDRLIENLNRGQNERVFSVDRIKNEVSTLKKKEEALQKTEATLRNENLILQERIRDANNRIETVLKENRSLRAKSPKVKLTDHAQVQTPSEWNQTTKAEQSSRIWATNYRQVTKTSQCLVDSSTNTDLLSMNSNDETRRALKRAKLEYDELAQQFEDLSTSYERLEDEYRLYKQQLRRKDSFDTAAVALLEDKLRAKQREIDRQRQNIEQLERQLHALRINR